MVTSRRDLWDSPENLAPFKMRRVRSKEPLQLQIAGTILNDGRPLPPVTRRRSLISIWVAVCKWAGSALIKDKALALSADR
jgi:hypothetical protein